jgi:ribonuclease Z
VLDVAQRLVMLLAVAFALAGCDRLLDWQIERNLTRVDASVLTSPDLQVVLCGTGSPLADATRAGACTAVIAGGVFVLVDVGPGSWEQVDLANLPIGELAAVLLTHFHSDHIGDLGEAITQSWIAGRKRPLDVYGPPGVARIVAGLREVYALDVEYRVRHHGEDWLPREAAFAVAHEIALPPEGSTDAVVVFEQPAPPGGVSNERPASEARAGLRVTAFRVDHSPVSPAIGYRFDWRGRSVVVSGDTRKSASVVANARGADLLVHEALQPALTERAVAVARRLGLERIAKLAGDIPSYHTTPREAAEVAREAGVKQLVLSHLVPGPTNALAKRLFLDGAGAVFPGEITLGEDGMRFALAPAGPP